MPTAYVRILHSMSNPTEMIKQKNKKNGGSEKLRKLSHGGDSSDCKGHYLDFLVPVVPILVFHTRVTGWLKRDSYLGKGAAFSRS